MFSKIAYLWAHWWSSFLGQIFGLIWYFVAPFAFLFLPFFCSCCYCHQWFFVTIIRSCETLCIADYSPLMRHQTCSFLTCFSFSRANKYLDCKNGCDLFLIYRQWPSVSSAGRASHQSASCNKIFTFLERTMQKMLIAANMTWRNSVAERSSVRYCAASLSRISLTYETDTGNRNKKYIGSLFWGSHAFMNLRDIR